MGPVRQNPIQKNGNGQTDRLGVREEVSRHDEVLASRVQSRREVLALAVDQLETLADALGVRAVSVDQLIRGPDQPQHRLLDLLYTTFTTSSTSSSSSCYSSSLVYRIHPVVKSVVKPVVIPVVQPGLTFGCTV